MIDRSDSGRRFYFYDSLPNEAAGIFSGGMLLGLCGAGLGFLVGDGLAHAGVMSEQAGNAAWIYGAVVLPVLWWALMLVPILTADERVNRTELALQWIALNKHLPAVAEGISMRAAMALAVVALLKDKEEPR